MIINLKRVLWIAAGVAILWVAYALLTRRAARPVPMPRASNESITPPPAPSLDDSMWTEGQSPEGRKYRLNLSTATFQFDIEPWSEKDARIGTRLWPSYEAAFDALRSRPEPRLTSLDVVVGLAKFQEDEILAALELFLLRETETFLDRLTRKLQTHASSPAADEACRAALAWAWAAKTLCQPSSKPDNKRAKDMLANFRSSKAWAEPLSFYAESRELENAWAVQRFFRTPFAELFSEDPRTGAEHWLAWAALYQTLAEDPDLARSFALLSRWSVTLEESEQGFSGEKLLVAFQRDLIPDSAWQNSEAIKRFFKPFHRYFPRGVAFLPPAIPVENLFISIARQRGTDTMERVLKGLAESPKYSAIDDASGWYARQRFALMPLLRPDDALESYKLALTGAYRERLRKAFSASLTKVRETHVSRHNLSFGTLAYRKKPQMFALKPSLEVEPQATVFLRQAGTARWLKERLTAESKSIGSTEGALQQAMEQLNTLEQRSLGLFCVAATNLGMTNTLAQQGWPDADSTRLEEAARRWLQEWPKSRLAKRDARVAVPVVRSGDSVTYWSTIGIQVLRLRVSFLSPPALEIQTDGGEYKRAEWIGGSSCRVEHQIVKTMPETFLIAADVFAEFTRSGRPLTREGFRDLLPRNSTIEKTKAKLQ